MTLGVDIHSLDYKSSNQYKIGSASSYATAVVSGVAAVLLEKHKDISLVKSILKTNSYFSFFNGKCMEKGEFLYLNSK